MATQANNKRAPNKRPGGQRGGFLLGLIVGLLAGLALALGVALYVTKVPIPFVNKVPQHTSDRDAQEQEKNRNWDPNSPLYGKNPARPAAAASGVIAPPPAPPSELASAPTPVVPPAAPTAQASAPRSSNSANTGNNASTNTVSSNRDPAAILADRPPATSPTAPAAPADPSLVSTKPRDDPFTYFIQVGAYSRTEEAEQQRAKVAMLGFEARVTEREQSGRTVYRVRLGPFPQREQADAAKERLENAAVEAALVRVQK